MRALFALIVVAACGAPATLTRVESEVFKKSCLFSGCHSGSASAEGLNLDSPTYAKLVNVKAKGAMVTNLTLVVPGKPDDSYLYQKLTQTTPAMGTLMPQTGEMLDAPRLQLVKDWIAAGAENN